jgi:hypothetical protein
MSGMAQRESAAEGAGKAASLTSIAGSEGNETTIERLYREHYRALVHHSRRWVEPHDPVRNRELLEWLNQRVSDPESRRLIRCLQGGMTLAEIAETEKVPVGTVKPRIHSFWKTLRMLHNNLNLSAS